MIGLLFKYRWFLAAGSLAAFTTGAWAHGYFKGKNHERAAIAKEQIALISEAQKDREAIDDEVRKLDSTAIDNALAGNGWLRPNNEL